MSALGEIGPSLFVFKGSGMPYREVFETLQPFLPRNPSINMLEDIASVHEKVSISLLPCSLIVYSI